MNNIYLSKTRLVKAALLVLALAWLPLAQAQPETQAPSTEPVSFSLKHLENYGTMLTTIIRFNEQEVVFKKEPDFGDRDIKRGAIKVGPERQDIVGFALDCDQWILYVDQNRNLDLTDDPEGVYQTEQKYGNFSTFDDVKIEIEQDGLKRVYGLTLNHMAYNPDSVEIEMQSGWRDEIELKGRKWILEVQDNGDGRFDVSDRFRFQQPSDLADGVDDPIIFESLPINKRIFIDGRLYEPEFSLEAAEEGPCALTATFTPVETPMGKLALDGQYIRQMVLTSNDGTTLLLDSPAASVSLPVGEYRIGNVRLQAAPDNPIFRCMHPSERLVISANEEAHLAIGGPLNNRIEVSRTGSTMNLSYSLTDKAGHEFSAVQQDYNNSPKYAVLLNGHEVASGSFDYG